jgi:hypothetical protein
MKSGSANNELAEKIALLLQEKESGDLDSLRDSLAMISDRLDRIEAEISSNPSSLTSAIVADPKSTHPSQHRYLELLADQITENMTEEKACPYEPAGKPCDHCAMCNSRGF